MASFSSVDLSPSQLVHVGFCVKRWEDGAEGIKGIRKYVRRKIGAVLRGEEIDPSEPPPLEVSCTHFSGVGLFFLLGAYTIAHEGLAIVRSNPHIRLGRHLLSRSTKQAKARPAIALEGVSKHTERIPPQGLPIIQPGLSRCARILGDTTSRTVRTYFGVRADFGSGAWGFGKYN